MKNNLDNRVELNGVKVHPFTSTSDILNYVTEHKGILVIAMDMELLWL